MAYCGPRGIPYSHWLGGPPGWDHLSRDAAIAWAARDGARHTGPGQCGQHPDLWTDEDGTELPDHAVPLVPKVEFCLGCSMIEQAHENATGDNGRLPAGVRLTWAAAPASPDGDDEP